MLSPFKCEHFKLDNNTCIIEHGHTYELASMLKVKCLSFTPIVSPKPPPLVAS